MALGSTESLGVSPLWEMQGYCTVGSESYQSFLKRILKDRLLLLLLLLRQAITA